MEKLTTLGLSADRVIIQVIIPGMLFNLPYAVLFLEKYPETKQFFIINPTIMLTAYSVSSLITGMLIENFGSLIEARFYDRINDREFKNYNDIWNKFLLLVYEGNEPIGHRYLRNIVLRMKFELSIGIALIFLSLGFVILDFHINLVHSKLTKLILFYLIPISISIYLLVFEAYNSSKVLARTREMLVKKYYKY